MLETPMQKLRLSTLKEETLLKAKHRFNELYDIYAKGFRFRSSSITGDEFTITKANELLHDKFNFSLGQNPFVIIAVPSVFSDRKILFFGFKGTDKMYGIALDGTFSLVKQINGKDVIKNVNAESLLSIVGDLQALSKQDTVEEESYLFNTIDLGFSNIFTDTQPQATESWVKLEIYDNGNFSARCTGSFNSLYVDPTLANVNRPPCTYRTRIYENVGCEHITRQNECCNFNAVKEIINLKGV